MANDSIIDIYPPFDKKNIMAESQYERYNSNQKIFPEQIKTAKDKLIAKGTYLND